MTVNSKPWHARAMVNQLRQRINFPLYQATSSNDIWSILGGVKDDFFIYDRCGRLTYHIPLPQSSLHYPIIQQAIISTYHDNPCGDCPNEDNADGLIRHHGRGRESNRTPGVHRLRHRHPIDIGVKVQEGNQVISKDNQGSQRR